MIFLAAAIALASAASAAEGRDAAAFDPAGGARPPDAPVRVECDGEVEWKTGATGGFRLVLSGGVRAIWGDLVVCSRRAEAIFEEGRDVPSTVLAEGAVTARSARFEARAARAELVRVHRASQAGPPPNLAAGPLQTGSEDRSSFRLRLEPVEAGEVELVADGLELRCAGSAVYEPSRRELHLARQVRGGTRSMRLACEEAEVVFAPPESAPRAGQPAPSVEGGEGGPAGSAPPAAADDRGQAVGPPNSPESGRPARSGPLASEEKMGLRKPKDPAVEKIELRGSVEIETIPSGEVPRRRMRSGLARYEAAGDVLMLSSAEGGGAPQVESAGIVLSAPEMRIYLRDGRIESATGRLRAVVEPAPAADGRTGEGP